MAWLAAPREAAGPKKARRSSRRGRIAAAGVTRAASCLADDKLAFPGQRFRPVRLQTAHVRTRRAVAQAVQQLVQIVARSLGHYLHLAARKIAGVPVKPKCAGAGRG